MVTCLFINKISKWFACILTNLNTFHCLKLWITVARFQVDEVDVSLVRYHQISPNKHKILSHIIMLRQHLVLHVSGSIICNIKKTNTTKECNLKIFFLFNCNFFFNCILLVNKIEHLINKNGLARIKFYSGAKQHLNSSRSGGVWVSYNICI